MTTTAIVIGRSPKHGTIWLRVPELHPHRILTLEVDHFPDLETGASLQVKVKGSIESREPYGPGWTAFVVPA